MSPGDKVLLLLYTLISELLGQWQGCCLLLLLYTLINELLGQWQGCCSVECRVGCSVPFGLLYGSLHACFMYSYSWALYSHWACFAGYFNLLSMYFEQLFPYSRQC